MATRKRSGMTTSASVPDNGGDHSGGGGFVGYVDDVFSTYLTTEIGDGPVTVVNGIDLAGEGGLVWWKNRTLDNGNGNHRLCDTERGVNKSLISNGTYAEVAQENESVTSFNDDGFVFQNAAGGTHNYASWTFRKAKNFFDVVTYTGNGASDFSYRVPHNLGCQPGLVIFKNVSASSDWLVWTERCWGSGHNLILNTDDADSGSNEANGRGYVDPDGDHDLLPVATGTGVNSNKLGDEYVAYVFAADESMIKCGSFNATAGEYVDVGFEPQWLLVKSTNMVDQWWMFDTMRGWGADVNSTDAWLKANGYDAEIAASSSAGIHPNGFISFDGGGGEYIYMAIRRPNKPAVEFEPEELFAVNSLRQEPDPGWIAGFPTDLSLHNTVNEAGSTQAQSRLTGTGRLFTDQSRAEGPINANLWDYMDGNRQGNGVANGNEFQWMWRRAPGFFDVVAYEGDGQDPRGISHNLGVEPEMMWSKCRSVSQNWYVYVKGVTSKGRHLALNLDNKIISGTAFWEGHNEDQFFVQGNPTNWANQTHITYLFASVPGISKVGSYTGQLGGMTIDCGFTTGARLVLIKRTDAAGDWYMATGPSLIKTISLNTTAGAVDSYYFTPDPSGFYVNSSGADKNANIEGAEYIYYAIA